MNTKKFFAVLSFFLAAIFLIGCNQETQVVTPDESSLEKKMPSAEETEGLIYIRLAEKLARDVYTTLGYQYDYVEFENFQVIEQRHMDKVLRVLDKYAIVDPIVSDEIGVFTNYPEFQELYNTNIALENPLDAGIAIEGLIINYLTTQLNEVVYKADIEELYTCLLLSAQNHLVAFEN